jgi:hypothetical protein
MEHTTYLPPIHFDRSRTTAVISRLSGLVHAFAPISLKQMDAVALLNRTDTKFILTNGQLLEALTAVQADYHILSVNGQRLNHYRTLYFDTPGFALYHLHVNGRADCYKVRSREYTDSRESFLEVKHKTCKGRTIKSRIATPRPLVEMDPVAAGWLHGVYPYDSRVLDPVLWNTFNRITLVSKQQCERVTLDVDLSFYTDYGTARLDGLAVAEVKMDLHGCRSPFLAQMRAQHISPRGFSKYVMGVSMLYQGVKKNALKPKLLWIEKLNRGL